MPPTTLSAIGLPPLSLTPTPNATIADDAKLTAVLLLNLALQPVLVYDDLDTNVNSAAAMLAAQCNPLLRLADVCYGIFVLMYLVRQKGLRLADAWRCLGLVRGKSMREHGAQDDSNEKDNAAADLDADTPSFLTRTSTATAQWLDHVRAWSCTRRGALVRLVLAMLASYYLGRLSRNPNRLFEKFLATWLTITFIWTEALRYTHHVASKSANAMQFSKWHAEDIGFVEAYEHDKGFLWRLPNLLVVVALTSYVCGATKDQIGKDDIVTVFTVISLTWPPLCAGLESKNYVEEPQWSQAIRIRTLGPFTVFEWTTIILVSLRMRTAGVDPDAGRWLGPVLVVIFGLILGYIHLIAKETLQEKQAKADRDKAPRQWYGH